jgi:hypothetical protein
MSKNSIEGETRGDDIDLLDLFARIKRTIGSWLNAIGSGFLISFAFILRNFWSLVLAIIFGICLSFLAKWASSPVFVSDITLRSNTVPNSDMIEFFGKLTAALKERNYQSIANSLSISTEKASKIVKIKPFWVIDINKDNVPDYIDFRNKFNVYDTLNQRMQDRFIVEAIVKDPSILPDISKGLTSFPGENVSFRLKNEFRIRKNDALLQRLTYDIKQLDSLQKVKYFEETRNRLPEKGGQIIFLQEQKTQLVYADIYNLYQRKQSIEQENELYKDILTVLSDFSIPIKRFNGGTYFGKIVIPASVVLMLFGLIIFANRKRLKDFYRKY